MSKLERRGHGVRLRRGCVRDEELAAEGNELVYYNGPVISRDSAALVLVTLNPLTRDSGEPQVLLPMIP
jgi:hypothetical protein